MRDSSIGTYTDKFSEIGNVRQVVSIHEFQSLVTGKRTITSDNMPYNEKLVYWLFSPHSGLYFKRNLFIFITSLFKTQVRQGFVFMVIDEEHEYNLRAGVQTIGQKYKIANVDYYKHYLPLVEYCLELEVEESRDVRDNVKVAVLKDKINKIIKS